MNDPSETTRPPIAQVTHMRRRPHRALLTAFPVVLDACVLCNPTIRDFILGAADLALFRPLWSKDILDELRRTLVKFEIAEARISYLIEQMTIAFPEAEVDGYETVIPAMTNHEKDRHVLATAVVGRAQLIVTENKRDFPEDALKPYQIETIGADDFLRDLLDVDKERMLDALATLTTSRKLPPKTIDEILAALVANKCSGFAADLEAALKEEYGDS